MARTVGRGPACFCCVARGRFLVLCGAFVMRNWAPRFRRPAAVTFTSTKARGPLWGYLFGWMSSVLERPVGIATWQRDFCVSRRFFFRDLTPLFTTHIGSYEFNFTVAQPLAALVVVAVTAVNYLSVKFGGGIQVFLTVLKTGTILRIVIGGMFYSRYTPNDFPTTITVVPTGFAIIGAVLTAMVPAMWAYNGFNDLGDLGEEIEQPGKNIPRAIVFGFLTVGTLYLLANVVYFRVLAFSTVAQSMHVASDVVQRLAGPHGAAALTVAMAISALGALHVVILTGARIPYAMARDGVFFRSQSACIPRNSRTPQRLAPLSRRRRSGSRAHRNLRGALLAVRLRCLDFLRAQRHRVAAPAHEAAESESSLPCVRLSGNRDRLLSRRDRAHGKSLACPPRSLHSRPARHRRRHPTLPPLAENCIFKLAWRVSCSSFARLRIRRRAASLAGAGAAAAFWPSSTPNCVIIAKPEKSHFGSNSSLGWW